MGDEIGSCEAVSVHVTASDLESARLLARALVEEHLAACVNVLPGMRSVYRWQGELHEDDEVLLLVKSRRTLVPALLARIAELHAYEVPCALVLPIVDGLPAYLAWLAGQTARPED